MDLTGARWRKSPRSNGSGGACVEVADNLPGVVAVRDSKDPSGPVLAFGPGAWGAFLSPVLGPVDHPIVTTEEPVRDVSLKRRSHAQPGRSRNSDPAAWAPGSMHPAPRADCGYGRP
ncbi:hypothetical protein GCM10010429_56090 [Micromonospora olivasterospora]|uniref:Uncharacterized protein DUF397 n=1 Tax=Micromonospora olivasterospora TaxID=1880 RepID=A0A562I4N8_MICOL|nr:uncharacterized protein DUF397 [Micromonospora olivasterospora]